MIEKLFALAVVVVCVLLLVRQFIGSRRRYAIDTVMMRMTSGARRAWRGLQARWSARGAERTSRQASRMADDVIRRAREKSSHQRDVARDGNVYTPKSFSDKRDSQRTSKRDTLH